MQLRLTFEKSTTTFKAMHRWSSAVVHNEVTPGRTNDIYKYFNGLWTLHSKCQAKNSTIAFVNDNLVTIGGQLYRNNEIVYVDLLYTLHKDGTWRDNDLPPMQKERDSVIAVTNGKALIVAGGCGKVVFAEGRNYPTKTVSGSPLKTVEVLYLETTGNQWQYVSELPIPFYHASVTICGDRVFILGPSGKPETFCVLTCQLTNLVLSRGSSEWSEISKVPQSNSTCVTFKGHLLAIGGLKPDHSPSNEVFCYDAELDSWNFLCHLKIARELCFAAVLSNKLFVIGGKSGSIPHSSMEIGTFL